MLLLRAPNVFYLCRARTAAVGSPEGDRLALGNWRDSRGYLVSCRGRVEFDEAGRVEKLDLSRRQIKCEPGGFLGIKTTGSMDIVYIPSYACLGMNMIIRTLNSGLGCVDFVTFTIMLLGIKAIVLESSFLSLDVLS